MTQPPLWPDDWTTEPCHDVEPEPTQRPPRRLPDNDLATLYQQLTTALHNTPWPDENHTRAKLATRLGHVEREMQRRNIWWQHQPDLPTRTPAPRAAETRYGHGLDHPDDEPRIIPGDHGQPPGRPRDLEPRVIHNVLETL